nr:hypothetical protein [Megasphaera elsdenii]
MLFCRQDPDSIFLELIFVDSAVIAAAAESVQLVDDDILERFPGAVGDHAQEIRPVIGPGRQGPVDVGADDFQILTFRVGRALANLAVDGLFPLFVRGKTGIDDGFCSFFH